MNTLLFSIHLLACTFTASPDTSAQQILLDEAAVVASVKENAALRELPLAATSVSARQMEALHTNSLKSVSSLVPNLFIPDYGSRLTSAIYIRGVGARMNNPAVGLYVDDMPWGDKSAFDFGFYDIERVEVLRGPQGTLFGRNAMGGIVRVHSKSPVAYEGTDLTLGYATGDNHRNISLSHYHHVSNHLAFVGGGYYEGGSGFFTNALTGRAADGLNSGGGRVRGIYRPTDHISLDFNANYDYSCERAYPYFYAGSLSPAEDMPQYVGEIANNRENSYRRSLLNVGGNLEWRAPNLTLNAVTSYQHLRDNMVMDQDFLPQDVFTLEQRQRIHTITEELTLKDCRRADNRWHWVTGANVMYQTLRTIAPVTFYSDGVQFLTSQINAAMPPVSQIPALAGMGFTDMSVNFRSEQLAMEGTHSTPTLNLALFHQSTVRLVPRLTLTVGLRLDMDYMRLKYDAPAAVDYGFKMTNSHSPMMSINLQQLSSSVAYEGTMRHTRLCALPKVALQYDFVRVGNLYASASMGQRSGGYNLQMFSDLLQGKLRADMLEGVKGGVVDYLTSLTQNPNIPIPPTVAGMVGQMLEEKMPAAAVPAVEQIVYRPERSWNFEVGTHLNLLSSRLLIDAAAFYIATRDQQIARFAPTGLGRMMVNAGRSRSVGGELAAAFAPTVHWRFAATYGYTHARFTRYDAGDGHDYSGLRVPFVPEHTLHLDAAYTWLLSHSRWAETLTLGADYAGCGRLYWTEANNASEPYYSLLGARLSLRTKWATVQLWGKNLTNTHYRTFYFESVGRGYEQHGKPLQFGVDVKIRLAR